MMRFTRASFRFALPLLAALCWVAPAPAAGQEEPSEPPNTVLDPIIPEYRIGFGDLLQLFVWREPEISRDLTVRNDGKISVPLIGDIQAAGRSPEELAGELEARLALYISAPRVTVVVSEARSARFFVVGRVARPGQYPLVGNTTVTQALAIAGGFVEFARTDRIVIIRETARRRGSYTQFVNVDFKELENARDASQNVQLLPGDTVLVP